MHRTLLHLVLAAALCGPALASEWNNYGGNAARNGQSDGIGPVALDLAWQNKNDYSIISWAPFLHGGRVFTIREAGFPVNGGAANDALVALDLASGAEDWRLTLPFGGNTGTEWIAWIAGARDGQVYASRSSNGKPQPLHAYDAASGGYLWTSAIATEAWAHDGVVFAPDGDLIVGDHKVVARIDRLTGGTAWSTPRTGSVSGNCGAAATASALFIDEVAPGGQVISKLDLVTGARLYSSPVMAGFTEQNSPFLSSDGGTVYLSRTQNNPAVHYLFAFQDTGAQLIQLWSRPVRWTTSHEHGIGPDGSLYTFLANNEFVRLDPATGAVLNSAGILAPIGTSNLSPKTAVDRNGCVYVSNGWASSPATDGRLWAFTPDLQVNLFTLPLDRPNAGGPALAGDGTMVVCDRTGVFAYRSTWTDLGFALAGTLGAPRLEGQGDLRPFTTAALALSQALPGSLAGLVIGAQNASLPFYGGVLVPFPSIVIPGLPTGPLGTLPLLGQVPGGLLSGVPLYFQYWILDPGAPQGYAASNAVTVTAP